MCPANITDPNPNGTPSPVQTRCAYEDSAGGGITKLGGKVYVEGSRGGLGTGAPNMIVTVHRVRDPARKPGSGEQVARTTTDAQGGFHLSALLPPAQYDVVVRDPANDRVLVFRRIRLEGVDPRTLESIQLTIPAIEQ
jgi:hypothetical protein